MYAKLPCHIYNPDQGMLWPISNVSHPQNVCASRPILTVHVPFSALQVSVKSSQWQMASRQVS